MSPEKGKIKPLPYGDSVYRSVEKTETEWEFLKNETHKMCEPMFAYVEKIQDAGLKTNILNIVQEINIAAQRISYLLKKQKNTADQQVFIEAQIIALGNIEEQFLFKITDDDKKCLGKLQEYAEGTFLKYIRNLPVRK